MNKNTATTFLLDVEGPSDADLDAIVVPEDDDTDGWEALLEPVVTVTKGDEDYWNEDENVHDDRYDGDGVPSWSAWA